LNLNVVHNSYGKYPSLGPLMYMRSKFYIFWSGLINLMHSDWNLWYKKRRKKHCNKNCRF
jgi:hypothetical protein